MLSRISLWVGLIGVAATIPLVQTVAVAKSSVEMHRIGKAITVLITSNDGQGSGVILQHQGDIYTVLTAAHVVRKKVNYKITTPDERQYEVIGDSIQTSPGDIDLAVVKFKATTKYTTAKLGNCNTIEGGMDLYVTGFPALDEVITATTLVVREGKVTANSNKTFANGYSLIYSNDTLRGMSGGAVLNNEGELVAIHGKGDRNKDKDGENAEKNGYNVGISINRFQTVASRMGVELNGQVAALSPDGALKADDYYASGVQKYQQGDYRGAVADYDRAIQINPNYAGAYNNRGNLKSTKLNDIPGALADYSRAIQISPQYAIAYYNRGILKKEKLDDIQGAIADYSRAIQINPNYAIAYNNRGSLKSTKLNDIPGALADFDRAIQINPNFAKAYYNRGNLKSTKLNDIPGALADLNRAIQIDPNYANAYSNRGNLKSTKLNDIPGALADLNRAIQIDPNYANAYGNRGLLKYNKLKDRAGAINDLQQAAMLFQQQKNQKSYQQTIDLLKKWQQTGRPIASII